VTNMIRKSCDGQTGRR